MGKNLYQALAHNAVSFSFCAVVFLFKTSFHILVTLFSYCFLLSHHFMFFPSVTLDAKAVASLDLGGAAVFGAAKGCQGEFRYLYINECFCGSCSSCLRRHQELDEERRICAPD